MRRLILLLVVLVPSFAAAQEALEPEWVIRREGNGLNPAEAWGIDSDAAGALYWAVSAHRPGLWQGFDVQLYRLDADGREVWPAPALYADRYAQQAYVVEVHDGAAYVGGRHCRSAVDVTLRSCDALVWAVDAATAATRWATTWDRADGYEEVDGLVPEPGGGLTATGWTEGATTNWDLSLLRLDEEGDVVWSAPWGTDRVDHQDGHAVALGDLLFLAGLYDGVPNGIIPLNGFDGQALLAKFDRTDGRALAHVTWGRDDPWTNFENALGLATDGTHLYVVGVTTPARNDHQIFVRKLDRDLRTVWHREWGGPGTDTARSIAVARNGTVVVAGSTDSYGAGEQDVVLLGFRPDGTLLDARLWGGPEDDEALDLHLAGPYAYVTGRSASGTANGRPGAFLMKLRLPRPR
jgi:hypothetical protein